MAALGRRFRNFINRIAPLQKDEPLQEQITNLETDAAEAAKMEGHAHKPEKDA